MKNVPMFSWLAHIFIVLAVYTGILFDNGNPYFAGMMTIFGYTVFAFCLFYFLLSGKERKNMLNAILLSYSIILAMALILIAVVSYAVTGTWADPKWGSVGFVLTGVPTYVLMVIGWTANEKAQKQVQ